jgi:hypothetical protein
MLMLIELIKLPIADEVRVTSALLPLPIASAQIPVPERWHQRCGEACGSPRVTLPYLTRVS